MGLNFIRSEIRYADAAEDIAHIPDELWKVALRAEFGTLGSALEEMREAERALREAISRRAPQREIDLLFDRYNGAVETYLEELRRKALENPPEEQGGGEGGTKWCSLHRSVTHSDAECKVQQQQQANNGSATVANMQHPCQYANAVNMPHPCQQAIADNVQQPCQHTNAVNVQQQCQHANFANVSHPCLFNNSALQHR